MINNLFNGAELKKYSKHRLYSNSSTNTNTITNHLKTKQMTQSHIFNSNNQRKDTYNSYTQRILYTKDRDPIKHSQRQIQRQNQSLINALSPRFEKKYNCISKTSGPQTPAKSLSGFFISLKISYKSQLYIINIGRSENGFILANRLNNELRFNLSNDLIESLAFHLTKEINKIIESIAYPHFKFNTTLKSNSNSNVNGFVIDLNDLLIKSSKVRICIKYNEMMFNYEICNTQEEISNVIEDITQHINIDKYDKKTLKNHIRKSIIESIDKLK